MILSSSKFGKRSRRFVGSSRLKKKIHTNFTSCSVVEKGRISGCGHWVPDLKHSLKLPQFFILVCTHPRIKLPLASKGDSENIFVQGYTRQAGTAVDYVMYLHISGLSVIIWQYPLYFYLHKCTPMQQT